MSEKIQPSERAAVRERLVAMEPVERQRVVGIARIRDLRRGTWPNWYYESRFEGRRLGIAAIDYERGSRIARWRHLTVLPTELMARPGGSLGLGTLFETLVLEDLVHAYGPLVSIDHGEKLFDRRVAQLARLGESGEQVQPVLDAIAHRRSYLAGKGYDVSAAPFRASIGRYLGVGEPMPL